jgi:hypothetical protein
VRRFQGEEAGLFPEAMQHFLLLRRNDPLALPGQQTTIQTLTGGWQLAPRDLPQGVVVKVL